MRCSKCGAELKPGAKFCGMCGTMIPTPQGSGTGMATVCPHCGTPVAAGSAFCPSCGTKLGAGSGTLIRGGIDNPGTIAHGGYGSAGDSSRFIERGKPLIPQRTDRSIVKSFFLGLITFGIYNIVMRYHMTEDLNNAARHDGKNTMNYLAACGLSLVTAGIYYFVYMHKFYDRVHNELAYRGINYEISTMDYWLWGVLGSLLFFIGPFIAEHKLLEAMNLINAHYNIHG